LQSGDCLLLYTDGVTEAANAQDEEFGEERLLQLLLANSGARATALQQAISRVIQFSRKGLN